MEFPNSAAQFADRIQNRNGWIRTGNKFHVGTLNDAWISFSYNKAWVNLMPLGQNKPYSFGLSRLHEGSPTWSWQRQITSKGWSWAPHFRLLNALDEAFPVSS